MKGVITTSIVGLVVEFVVAIDEARVRFTDDARFFLPFFLKLLIFLAFLIFICFKGYFHSPTYLSETDLSFYTFLEV